MAIESNLAGVVRVAYEAVTGEFNRETEHAARTYVASNEKISDSAIKLELAQDKLRRSLAKGPAAAREQQRALLAVRAAEREVAAESRKLADAQDKTQRELRQTNRELRESERRAKLSGSAYRSLRSGIGFAVAGLIGGTGLVYGLKQAIDAGIEQDKILANLRNALKANGVSWDQYGDRIESATNKLKAQSAFDDEELYASLQLLVRGTHDVNRALELNALAANLARGRNMDLVKAAQLVVRVEAGQVGSLRRLGINVDKNAKSYEAIAYAQRKYAGAAQAYANTAAGAQDRVTVAIGDTEKAVGRALLPTFEHYANALSDWLQDGRNLERVQRDVNHAVEVGGKVVKGLADGLRIVKAVAEPVVDALGGIEKAAELALIVGIAAKARKAALGFLPLQASSLATAEKGVRDAGVFGRAWDIATRPRNMVVTTTGAGAPGVPGGPAGVPVPVGGGGRGAPKTVAGRIGQYGRTPTTPRPVTPTGGLAGFVIGSYTLGLSGEQSQGTLAYDPTTDKFYFVYPGGQIGAEVGDALARKYDPTLYAKAQRARRRSRAAIGTPGGDRPVAGEGARTGPAPTTRRTPRPTRRPTRRTMLDIQTDLARALTTPGTSDEEALYKEEAGRYRSQIAALERRKTLTKKQKETLQRLYGELGAAQSAVESIRSDREQALDQQAEAARRRRKAAADRAVAKRKAAEKAEEKRENDVYERLARAARLNNAQRIVPTSPRKRATTSSTADKADKPATAAEIAAAVGNAVAQIRQINERYAPNFQTRGDTHLYELVHESRRGNDLIDRLVARTSFPASGYAVASAEAAVA